MNNLGINIRNKILRFGYKYLLKPIFFLSDPEKVHDHMVLFGETLGKSVVTQRLTSLLFNYSNKKLEQKILGIKFINPIGLGAGFDKNAQLIDILPGVGFGFMEVGSITGEPCKGNPKPRLWRLKKSKSLVVNYGLKNDGCLEIAKRLKRKKFQIPVGTSIAKTNDRKTVTVEAGINDYVKACKQFTDIGTYFTINISCPNAYGGQPFTESKRLDKLLAKIDKIATKKPLFLKLSPDLSNNEIDDIIKVGQKHKVDGFICCNLSKMRKNEKIKEKNIPKDGGISGKAIEDLTNDLIAYVYKKTKGKFIIIGLGGVFSCEDAYKKIRLGASLVQLITGMIYEGPQVIGEINRGLVKLLEKDGYSNISEAIGVDNK
ncbi:dihydroorotate dehydrogenase (quinone) [Candidatus Curtissbacteria bacterium RBG_13_35_7]|uniref:Dihydroorotate dehydrogenase (quinone) n=1 Tax=Candidatus Curtissbacteria bacterium RBG_13_35_7 TaxID=1797705 RepID=A0A1F5G0M5_9BACT|nr:MAG: dihydroorotate dehydrogenase (quinone) [Candidatus Curtissbacteria bacterium RBG_13_35_7]